jgi:hypothetical protein
MENLMNWKMFVDKKTGLCYIQNIADEWWEWSDHYDEWQEVLPRDWFKGDSLEKEGLVEIKEFIAEEDAFTWYPPSWIPDEGVDK